jgi:hypothetical protein
MSHRIDVELTSDRGDGTWTWRAAGARQPKGVVDQSLLPDGAAVGDVVRAEAENELDGVTIVSVTVSKRQRSQPERIEILGTHRDEPAVTANLARGGRKKDFGDFDGTDRRERRRSDGDDRGRSGGRSAGRDSDRSSRADRPAARDRRGPSRDRGDRRPERPAAPQRPRPKRLRAGRTHRQALINQLPAEQRPVAELVLRGGVPLVRETLQTQGKAARAQGMPAVNPGPVIDVAEKLAPHARLAEWQDRADAALAQAGDVDLRDLRSVVVAADGVARHEQTRETAEQLRAALSARVEAEHRTWLDELGTLVSDGRVVAALRLSSRPPKAGIPLPAPLAAKLTELVVTQLAADTPADRYATVLDALAFSPVRAQPVPAEVPANPPAALTEAVARLGDRIPQIAAAFGIEPAPAPARGRSPGRSRRPRPGTTLPASGKPPQPPPPPGGTADTPASTVPVTQAYSSDAPAGTASEPVADATPAPADAEAPEVAPAAGAETPGVAPAAGATSDDAGAS